MKKIVICSLFMGMFSSACAMKKYGPYPYICDFHKQIEEYNKNILHKLREIRKNLSDTPENMNTATNQQDNCLEDSCLKEDCLQESSMKKLSLKTSKEDRDGD